MGRLIEAEEELAEVSRAVRVAAVIGMKDESSPDRAAFTVPARLQALGVRVIPVNPRLRSALGERAYATIGEVEERFDLVLLFRPSRAIAPHADEILALPPERRPAVVWMQTGIRDEASARRLMAAGMDVVMDRCLSVMASRYRVRRA